jgi:hypothetical protein
MSPTTDLARPGDVPKTSCALEDACPWEPYGDCRCRVDDLVKDGAISAVTRVFDALRRRRLRRSTILDKIINTNKQHPCDQGRHTLSGK